MGNEDKYSLPKTIIGELKDPVKLKGIWSIIKVFPAILFLVALYLIADRYIDSKEQTEFEKIKKEFLYRSIDDLSSNDPVKRQTTTLMVGMILADSEDPDVFYKMMYETDSDSSNKAIYRNVATKHLILELFMENEKTGNKAYEQLKSFWMYETDLIPGLIETSYQNKENEKGIERAVRIINAYPTVTLKKDSTQIRALFDQVRNINSETHMLKNEILGKIRN